MDGSIWIVRSIYIYTHLLFYLPPASPQGEPGSVLSGGGLPGRKGEPGIPGIPVSRVWFCPELYLDDTAVERTHGVPASCSSALGVSVSPQGSLGLPGSNGAKGFTGSPGIPGQDGRPGLPGAQGVFIKVHSPRSPFSSPLSPLLSSPLSSLLYSPLLSFSFDDSDWGRVHGMERRVKEKRERWGEIEREKEKESENDNFVSFE